MVWSISTFAVVVLIALSVAAQPEEEPETEPADSLETESPEDLEEEPADSVGTDEAGRRRRRRAEGLDR